MFSFLRRFASVLGLLAASQALNALSLVLIPVILDPRWADAYALGLQVGVSAYGGVVLGVVYNVAIGRPLFARWGLSALLCGLFSVLLGALTVAVTFLIGADAPSITEEGLAIVGVFAVGGAGLAVAGTGGVREACMGRPALLSAVNLAPAVALLCGLIVIAVWDTPSFVAAGVWACAAWGQVPVYWAHRGRSETSRPVEVSSAKSYDQRQTVQHVASLAVGVIASTVIPTLLIAALTQLPAGATAMAFVVVRIGTSIVGIGVNSLLIVRYNWQSATRDVRGPASVLSASAAALLATSAVLYYLVDVAALVLAVAAWTVLLVASALNLRETNARRWTRSITLKVAIDVSLSAVGCAVLFAFPSVGTYFGILLLSQAVTMLVTSSFFGYRKAVIASAAAVAGAIFWITAPLLAA